MGQILQSDSIGTLSHSSGVITLAASRLTIGGQQYTTSLLNRTISTDVTMTANTLYMIYAVVSGGVLSLKISSNVNSVGPSGFTYWKLVGAFYSNGLSSVSFGSFINITGIPQTENGIISQLTFSISGFSVTPVCAWQRSGRNFSMTFGFTKDGSVGTGGVLVMSLPTNIPSLVTGSANLSAGNEFVQINGGYIGQATFSTLSAGTGWDPSEVYVTNPSGWNFLTQPTGTGTLGGTSVLGNCVMQGMLANNPIAGWSTTPLKDL